MRIGILLIGLAISLQAHKSFDEQVIDWSKSIAQTLHIAHTKSFFNFDVDRALSKALDAFMKDIDMHGSFLTATEYQDLLHDTQGEFYGIGAVLDENLVILECLPDSPAQKHKLQAQDKIVAIDGVLTNSMSHADAIKKLKGASVEPVKLDILRGREIVPVVIPRSIVKEDPITCYYLPEQDIAYCTISVFTQQVAKELRNKLQKLQEQKLKGIIIDVRNNPGGILQSAVDCASIFLPGKQEVVTTKDKNKNTIGCMHSSGNQLDISVPVLFLVNELTASAAEILVGALHYYASKNIKRFPPLFTMGSCTHGKGSVQEVIPIDRNCALKLTTYLYYLPENKCIDRNGFIPDFVMPTSAMEQTDKRIMQKKQGSEAPYWLQDGLVQKSIGVINSINKAIKYKPEHLYNHQAIVQSVKKQLLPSLDQRVNKI